MSIFDENLTRRNAIALGVGGIAALLGYGAMGVLNSFGYKGTWQPGETVSVNTVSNWSYPPRPQTINGWVIDWGTRIEVSKDGKQGLAYCVNPSVSLDTDNLNGQMCSLWSITVEPGQAYSGQTFPSGYSISDVATFLWFALGGPGYNHDMWPKYYGDTLDEHQIYWTCHYLATYLIWGNGKSNPWQNSQMWIQDMIDAGADSNLVTWFNNIAIPFLANTILPRSAEVADDFPVFAINAYSALHNERPATQMCIASLPVDPTPKKGSLTVKKQVLHGGDTTKDFNFKVTFSGTGAPASQTFTLKSGAQKVISDIPYGVTYTVEETSYSAYTVTWSGKTGTIGASNSDAVCTCTNDAGVLIVKKTVSNGDPNKKFKFKVTFTGPDSATMSGPITAYNFELSANDAPKVFPEIFFGTKYSVEEITDGPYTTNWTNQSGTIDSSNPVVTCTCDNASGYVSMEKFFDDGSSPSTPIPWHPIAN